MSKINTAVVEGSGLFNDGVNNYTTTNLKEWREHLKKAKGITLSGTLECSICKKVAVPVDNQPPSVTTAICDNCKQTTAGLSPEK